MDDVRGFAFEDEATGLGEVVSARVEMSGTGVALVDGHVARALRPFNGWRHRFVRCNHTVCIIYRSIDAASDRIIQLPTSRKLNSRLKFFVASTKLILRLKIFYDFQEDYFMTENFFVTSTKLISSLKFFLRLLRSSFQV